MNNNDKINKLQIELNYIKNPRYKESAEVIQSPSGMILVTEDGTASLGHTTSIYKYVNGKKV